MRILLISGLTGRGLGGAQTEMWELVKGMAVLGHRLAFLIDTLPAGVTAEHFPLDYPPKEKTREQLTAAVSAFEPEVVHVVGGGLGLLRAVGRMKLAVPWCFTAHNLPPFERIYHRFHERERWHYLMRDARALPNRIAWSSFLKRGKFAAVVAHSDAIEGLLKERGCPGEKVRKIAFGSNPPVEHSTASDTGRIVTVAGLAHHKGIHDYVIAIRDLLLERHRGLRYQIFGQTRDKSYVAYLRELIETLEVATHVTLRVNAPDAEIGQALREASLYVQPSHEEGFCLAFMEAAMVVPRLIGTKTGEIAAIAALDPEAAVAVDPGDRVGLKSATEMLLAKAVSTEGTKERVRRISETYSWEQYFQRHAELYTSLASATSTNRT